MTTCAQNAIPVPSAEVYGAAWEAANAQLAYIPTLQSYAPLSEVSTKQHLASLQQQLQLLRNHMAKDGKKAGKLEKKLEVVLGGYRKRAAALGAQIHEQHQAIGERHVELGCFEALARMENLARPQRLAVLERFVREQVRHVSRTLEYTRSDAHRQ